MLTRAVQLRLSLSHMQKAGFLMRGLNYDNKRFLVAILTMTESCLSLGVCNVVLIMILIYLIDNNQSDRNNLQ